MAARLVRKALTLSDTDELPWPIKTIPVTMGLDVLEHMKVMDLKYEDTYDEDYHESKIARMLRGLILVPIMKQDAELPREWYMRSPILWVPSEDDAAQFRADYDAVRAMIRKQQPEQLSSAKPPSGQGKWLMVNTTGKDSSDRRDVKLGGTVTPVKPRGWMLRKDVIRVVVQAHLHYRGSTTPARPSSTRSLDEFDDG